ncbi:doubled CXXCH motif [bacterium BMS3Abin01]|nr:doubled CXXCH motif [bacterium BMS3Abin01]
MRKIAILAALVLSVAFILAFAATAFAQTSPHTGYAGTTDFCVACHDVHEAAGDYVLTRESTVTAVCGTCHGVFGASAPATVSWSSPKTDFAGADPTASTKLAYEVDMSAMSATQMDGVPGHSLGVMYGGTVVRNSDAIPGSSATLKVLTSGADGGPIEGGGLYAGEATTSFTGTQGLYCASCHSPHGTTYGQAMGTGVNLLSAKPNHAATAATDERTFCISCHDKRDNVGVENNHPSSMCLTCHANDSGGTNSDFPHTGANQRLLYQEPDGLCVLCHVSGTLP